MKKRKENKGRQILLGAIIVFIMVTSVIGFMAGQGDKQEVKYKDYSFFRKGNLWETKIDKKPVDFYYFPSELESIEVDENVIKKVLETPMIYITYDQTQKDVEVVAQMQFELKETLSENFNIYSMHGLEKDNEYGLPVITCLNATNAVPVIKFRRTNQTKISLKGNCVIMEGERSYDFVKAKDRLLYGLFGIIK